MRKILLLIAVMLMCVGICSCKGPVSGTVSDSSDISVTDSTDDGDSSDSPAESAEEPESFVPPDTADTESDTAVCTEPLPEETQVDNILKLPLTPENTKGYVYLTIDDGPSARTNAVLDILEEYNVDATFFFIGTKMNDYTGETVRAYRLGNNVGCHSMTHDYRSIYQNGQTIGDDISAWENTALNVIGEIPEYRLYRFPGGTTNTVIVDNYAELKSAVAEKGYRSFDWNCANCDKWLVPKPEEQSLEDYLKSSVISTLHTARGPKVMLIHETVKETVDMLPWIIEYIRSEGYEFALLSNFDGEYVFRK